MVSLFQGAGAVASRGNKRAVQAALSGDACSVLSLGNPMLRRALGDVLAQLVGKEDEEVGKKLGTPSILAHSASCELRREFT